jgi:hypothetical protein
VDEFAGSLADDSDMVALAIELRDLGKEFGFCRWRTFPIHEVIEHCALKDKRIRFHRHPLGIKGWSLRKAYASLSAVVNGKPFQDGPIRECGKNSWSKSPVFLSMIRTWLPRVVSLLMREKSAAASAATFVCPFIKSSKSDRLNAKVNVSMNPWVLGGRSSSVHMAQISQKDKLKSIPTNQCRFPPSASNHPKISSTRASTFSFRPESLKCTTKSEPIPNPGFFRKLFGKTYTLKKIETEVWPKIDTIILNCPNCNGTLGTTKEHTVLSVERSSSTCP